MFTSSALIAAEEESGYYATLYGYTTFIILVITIVSIILTGLLIYSLVHDGTRPTRMREDVKVALAMLGVIIFGTMSMLGAMPPKVLISIAGLQEKIDTAIDQAHTKYDRVYEEVMTYASTIHVSDEQECPQRMDASHQYICTQISQHTALIMTIEHESNDTTWRDKEALWLKRTRTLQDKQKILKEDIDRYHNLLTKQG